MAATVNRAKMLEIAGQQAGYDIGELILRRRRSQE
jgi:hypothetical protein